jgi:GcrA cell cycle regulator
VNTTEKNPVGVRKDSRWTDEMRDRLAVLWKDQNSASVIADKIFNEFGVVFTRNAVIGKVHRLKLTGQGAVGTVARKGESKKPRQKPKLAPIPAPKQPTVENFIQAVAPILAFAPLEEIEVAIPITGRVTLEGLRSCHCRWPCGDPRDENFSYCGDAAVPGKPYCAAHMQEAYVPVQRGKKVAWRAFR